MEVEAWPLSLRVANLHTSDELSVHEFKKTKKLAKFDPRFTSLLLKLNDVQAVYDYVSVIIKNPVQASITPTITFIIDGGRCIFFLFNYACNTDHQYCA